MIADVAMVVSELIETFSTSTVTVKLQWYFPTLALTYQLRSIQNFTIFRSYQLRFPTSRIPFKLNGNFPS